MKLSKMHTGGLLMDDRFEDRTPQFISDDGMTYNRENSDYGDRVLNFSNSIPIRPPDFSWHDRDPDTDLDYSVSDSEFEMPDPAGLRMTEFNDPSDASDIVMVGTPPTHFHDRGFPLEAFSSKSGLLGGISTKPHVHEGGLLVEPMQTRHASRHNGEWTGGFTVPDALSGLMALGSMGGLKSKYRLGNFEGAPERGYDELSGLKHKLQDRSLTFPAFGESISDTISPSGKLPKLVSIHLGTDESPFSIAFHLPMSLVNPALNDVLDLPRGSKTSHYGVGEERMYNSETGEPLTAEDLNLDEDVLKGLLSLDTTAFKQKNPHIDSKRFYSVMYPSINIQKMFNPDAFTGFFHIQKPTSTGSGEQETRHSEAKERGFTKIHGLEQIPNITTIKNLVKLVKSRI